MSTPTGDPATDARQIVDNLRQSNREYEERTGSPSTVSEAEYQKAEAEIREKLEKLAALSKRPKLAEVTEVGPAYDETLGHTVPADPEWDERAAKPAATAPDAGSELDV